MPRRSTSSGYRKFPQYIDSCGAVTLVTKAPQVTRAVTVGQEPWSQSWRQQLGGVGDGDELRCPAKAHEQNPTAATPTQWGAAVSRNQTVIQSPDYRL